MRPQPSHPKTRPRLNPSPPRHFDAVVSGAAQCFAEGGENGMADRILRLSPFRMPLDSQEKTGGLVHADRLDGAVRCFGLHAQTSRQAIDALAVQGIDRKAAV